MNGKKKSGDGDDDRITKRSWVEKVTDDSNLWLLATRLEAEGDFKAASEYYIQDAEEYEKKEQDSRVALSYLCAGRCKAKLGAKAEARSLYRLAGEHYTNFAEKTMTSSPHEASWGFAKAADCFQTGAYPTEARALRLRSKDIADALTPIPLSVRLRQEKRKNKNHV